MPDGPVSPGPEALGPVQGQPTPGEGNQQFLDATRQAFARVEAASRQIGGQPALTPQEQQNWMTAKIPPAEGGTPGTLRPTNEADRLNAWLGEMGEYSGSPEFYAKLREAFQRLETTRRILPTDVDVVVQGGREFGKSEVGVEDTADLDERGAKYAKATEAYWQWLLRKIS